MPSILREMTKQGGRTTRRPSHPFNIAARPFQIVPMLLAPMLPGDTMRNLLLQARCVTDPIKEPLIGWHLEYYFFGCKLRHLGLDTDIEAVFADPTANFAGTDQAGAAVPATYTAAGGVDFMQKCLDKVVSHYFRKPDETGVSLIGDYPPAKITQDDAFSSMMEETEYHTPDLDADLDADGTVTASEIEEALRRWQHARLYGTTEYDFHDWLAAQGIQQVEEDDRPELIRYIRQWSYPTNTIDPATGSPSSAVSWSVTERADKDRFFKEWGFVFGVQVVRPKVYRANQDGAISGFLQSLADWLPLDLHEHHDSSWKSFAAGDGPATGTTNPYMLDLRDLFMKGEQFVNTNASFNDVALPSVSTGVDYPSASDADSFFVDAASNLVRTDGVCSLTVASRAPQAPGR